MKLTDFLEAEGVTKNESHKKVFSCFAKSLCRKIPTDTSESLD